MNHFIDEFLSSFLREKSFFHNTLNKNKDILKKAIFKKNILVIGGAGSIGTNYIKELLKFHPKKVIVVDINENGLAELTRDLRSSSLLDFFIDFRTYPINLNDSVFDKLFIEESPFNIVANFAAHKHVRSEKDIFSIEALIKNNIFGAIKILNLIEQFPTDHFFSVSTDKAANPVNIMGASKSLMEKIIISYKNKFKVSSARFANVAFSNGSLLESFLKRVEKNQPISCPDDVKRFFVTPEESGQICLLATIIGKTGDVFFPKFNFDLDQIYFKTIALAFLEKLKLIPHICSSELEAKTFNLVNKTKKYPIYFFNSNTSGEKLYEEFYTENEKYDLNIHENLGVISVSDIDFDIKKISHDFITLFNKKKISKREIVNMLRKYLHNFEHIETGKNLDEKM